MQVCLEPPVIIILCCGTQSSLDLTTLHSRMEPSNWQLNLQRSIPTNLQQWGKLALELYHLYHVSSLQVREQDVPPQCVCWWWYLSWYSSESLVSYIRCLRHPHLNPESAGRTQPQLSCKQCRGSAISGSIIKLIVDLKHHFLSRKLFTYNNGQ